MSSKARPANAPGANGLRGGIKSYSLKTMTGQWLEGYGGPSGFQRGFTTTDFETEAQQAQIGATLRKAPEYGAALPNPLAQYKNSPRCADSFSSVGKDEVDWKTSTGVMQASVTNNKDQYYAPIPNLTREKLNEYRKQWTTDTEVGRNFRFSTVTRSAGNAANDRFQLGSVRLLPGTPKSLEIFRERLIEKYGILGLCVLRFSLGKSDIINYNGLKASVASIGVELKPYELYQIVAFITPSDTEIPVEGLFKSLKGNYSEFNSKPVESFFQFKFGSNTVSLVDVLEAINGESFPEVRVGVQQFLVAYSSDDDKITMSRYVLFHSDMFSSAPHQFEKVFADLWH